MKMPQCAPKEGTIAVINFLPDVVLSQHAIVIMVVHSEPKWHYLVQIVDNSYNEHKISQIEGKNMERFTILRVILAQGPC